MKTINLISFAAVSTCALLTLGDNAQAITVPDSGSCATTGGTCFQITDTAPSATAILGTASQSGSTAVSGSNSSGVGVLGESSTNFGVFGSSATGQGVAGSSNSAAGVFGFSMSNNGVLGQTNSPSNAAVSAVSPNSSGLAYWGTGGIIITGSLAQKAGGGSWTAPSDRRIKKDIRELDRGLVELMGVRPVRFKYNGLGGTSDDGHEYVGVIAQDLEKILPSMVSSRAGKLNKSDATETEIKQVDPSDFTYLLIKAVQEQQKTIQRQEIRISALERRNAPVALSDSLGSIETAATFGLLPVGLFVAMRRRGKGVR